MAPLIAIAVAVAAAGPAAAAGAVLAATHPGDQECVAAHGVPPAVAVGVAVVAGVAAAAGAGVGPVAGVPAAAAAPDAAPAAAAAAGVGPVRKGDLLAATGYVHGKKGQLARLLTARPRGHPTYAGAVEL